MPLLASLLAFQAAAAPPPAHELVHPRIVRDCARERAEGRIVVCGSDGDSPFRLPEAVRDPGWNPNGPVPSASRERNKLLEGDSGGLGSCTTVGPNGMNGCHNKGEWRRREQKGI